jgi:hypothetical protein
MPGPTSKQILLATGVVALGVAGYFLVRDRNTTVTEQDAAVSST